MSQWKMKVRSRQKVMEAPFVVVLHRNRLQDCPERILSLTSKLQLLLTSHTRMLVPWFLLQETFFLNFSFLSHFLLLHEINNFFFNYLYRKMKLNQNFVTFRYCTICSLNNFPNKFQFYFRHVRSILLTSKMSWIRSKIEATMPRFSNKKSSKWAINEVRSRISRTVPNKVGNSMVHGAF